MSFPIPCIAAATSQSGRVGDSTPGGAASVLLLTNGTNALLLADGSSFLLLAS